MMLSSADRRGPASRRSPTPGAGRACTIGNEEGADETLLARGLAAVCMLATACGGSSSSTSSGSSTSSKAAARGKVGGQARHRQRERLTWTCQFNPFNAAVSARHHVRLMYEPLEFVNILRATTHGPRCWRPPRSGRTASRRSRSRSAAESSGRTAALQRRRRRLHVQRDEGRQGDRPQRALERRRRSGHERRRSRGPIRSSSPSTLPLRRTSITSRTRPRSCRSTSGRHSTRASSPPTPTHNPVGTGPYTVSSCSAQNIKYLRNPNYWQSTPGHPVPLIKEIDYPAFLSNTPANLFLAQGQAQWGGQYIPNVKLLRRQGSVPPPHWFPPVLNVALVPNLDNPLLSQLPVRQAIVLRPRQAHDRPARRGRRAAACQPVRRHHADVPELGPTARSPSRPTIPRRPTRS